MAPKKKTTASNNVFQTIVRDVVKEELVPVNKRFDSIDRKFDSVDRRFDGIEEKLEQIEDTFQKFRNDIIDHIDHFVGEIKTYREEQTINAGQHQRFDDRLETLEKIHPRGQHAQI